MKAISGRVLRFTGQQGVPNLLAVDVKPDDGELASVTITLDGTADVTFDDQRIIDALGLVAWLLATKATVLVEVRATESGRLPVTTSLARFLTTEAV